MAELPVDFLQTMKELLGGEYEQFLEGFDGRRQYGLRVNTSKISLEEFERIAPFHLKKIPWTVNGYFYEQEDNPARHSFYAAGLYYLQEPSAMAPASRLQVAPGEKVLDLCAAPGGKATALGANLQGSGLLVANDINRARARALLRNIELFGIKNSLVTNEPPHVLAEKLPEYFDKIMVDAPCSGEGMFRKNPAVIDAWKEKGPDYFSRLQRDIIVSAADMLKPGGKLLYSTCTFSPLENEGTITHLLRERPDMEVIPMEDYGGFSEGFVSFKETDFHESCSLCRRIWPHKMPGEGHFMALLQKKEELSFVKERKDKKNAGTKHSVRKSTDKRRWWEVLPGFDKEQKQALEEFFMHVHWNMKPENVDIRKDKVYYVPETAPEDGRLHFLRYGVYLGDLKKKRFEPSQPFALALAKETYDQTIDLPEDDERLERYMRGETLLVKDVVEKSAKEGRPMKNGWYLILASGYPLGFGKLSGEILKNKYPAGWRKNN